MTVSETIRAARRCGTPLMIVRTADPSATIAGIKASLPSKDPAPVIRWDVVRGALGEDEASAQALSEAMQKASIDQTKSRQPAQFLACTRHLPRLSVVFMVNLHRFASEDIQVIQSLWNLRDEFKAQNKVIIGLVPQITLPAELQQDVLIIDEPLPTDADLKAIAADIYNAAQIEQPAPATLEKIVDATLGLAAFPAEQAMAMSITRQGMNVIELWDRKRQLIAQTPGLSVVPPEITLDDIGGVFNAKGFMRRVMAGKTPPRAIVFIDEGEKAFSGSSVGSGDTSGVSQNFLGTLLTEMQEKKYTGSIFVGFPGSAKSMLAKAAGATAGIPTIMFDLSAMKNSLVGASETNLRNALKTVAAVSQGRAYFIMTSNGIASLPPELKRRFKDAIFFFDIPDVEEKAAIWNLYLNRYAADLEGIDVTRPDDSNWTGAEIATCVENACRFGVSLKEAATYIVPAYQSMGSDKAAHLREEASGRFISASYPGPYQHKRNPVDMASVNAAPGIRAITFDSSKDSKLN